jgi:hypothetical protein
VPVGLLLLALTAPQPDLRFCWRTYKPDWLFLASFLSSLTIWLLWRIVAPPVSKLFYISLAAGLFSGAAYVVFVYLCNLGFRT